MATRTTDPSNERARYFRLVRKFPLRPIRSDFELTDAIAVIDSLVARPYLDAGERDYLHVLTDLVERYETETIPAPKVTDAQLLAHLIEAAGVTQSKLSEDIGVASSTVSQWLSGQRRMTRKHVGLVARYFHVEPGVFPT